MSVLVFVPNSSVKVTTQSADCVGHCSAPLTAAAGSLPSLYLFSFWRCDQSQLRVGGDSAASAVDTPLFTEHRFIHTVVSDIAAADSFTCDRLTGLLSSVTGR